MNDPEAEVPLIAGLVMTFVAIAAITALIMWIRRWMQLGYVLAYEPRRRVPWGPLAGVLAVLMTALSIWNVMAMRAAQFEAARFTAEEFAEGQFKASMVQLAFVVAIVAVLVVVNGASWRDLGLPTSSDQLVYDIMLGIWVALAAMVPLWILQVLAINLLGVPPAHPLTDQMQETPNWLLFVAAMMTAVVAAPIFEEFVFRLLLQGGLERLEDESVGWRFSLPTRREHQLLANLRSESTEWPSPNEDAPVEYAGEQAVPESGSGGPSLAAGDELWTEQLEPEDLPKLTPGGDGLAPGVDHGWMPILISSFLFALAHLGNGPSPVPLFVLALMLGYVYQRTHRITPCIVAHMVFNGVSVLIMILMLSQA